MNALQECMFVSMLENYQHGFIGSRELVRQTNLVTGNRALTAEILSGAGFSATELWARDKAPTAEPPQDSSGITINPDDPSISVQDVSYSGPAGVLYGYLSKPGDKQKHPGIVVIHENRGLSEHIKDVARRLAKAGYVVLAPDLLSRAGGTQHFTSLDDLQSSLRTFPPDAFTSDLNATLDYLKVQPDVFPDRLGMTGFCFGGGLTWRMLTLRPDLKAGVPFYGAAPPLEDVPCIKGAVLAIYAGLDERINATIPGLEQALKGTDVKYEKVMYPGVSHAFHNDTGINYNAEAAKNAWSRMLTHFAKYL
jgi:carboxymethylenebutenolidase